MGDIYFFFPYYFCNLLHNKQNWLLPIGKKVIVKC